MGYKAILYTANVSSQSVTDGDTINLGSVIRRTGSNINLSGNAIAIQGVGYYDVDVSVTAIPTTTGTMTVSLYKDGVLVPGATSSQATSTAGNPVSINFGGVVREMCCSETSNLTLKVSGVAGTISNLSVIVEKL